LIKRVIHTKPEGTDYEQNDDVFYSMVDKICIRLKHSLSAHSLTVHLDDRVFSDNVCADIILHIRLLVAKQAHLPTITFEAMHGESTVAVPRLKPELPSRGRKRSRKFPPVV
jgi:hypothetical protein